MDKIEIGEKIQILLKDNILEAKCSSIHTSECASVKETTYMLSTIEDDLLDIIVSISVREKKSEGEGIDTGTEEVSAS